MNFPRKLILFMQAKKDRITEVIGITFGELYFNEKDAEELRALSEDRAKEIYTCIEEEIAAGEAGLPEPLCPFCQINSCNCTLCNYGGRHGKCTEISSDFDQIACRFLEMDIFVRRLFSNEFFIKVIEEIEKGEI